VKEKNNFTRLGGLLKLKIKERTKKGEKGYTKKIFYSEIAYILGIILLALGTAFSEKADFGMSMVVAPAYVIHVKLSEYFSFFSFGMSEYIFQAFILIILAIATRKIKKSYFLSFATALVYGIVLDLLMSVISIFSLEGIVWRIVLYVLGLAACSSGVALLFHTYLPPEAYELFVKEIAQVSKMSIGKTKTIYDCCSCALAVILSLCFFGGFVGVKWGTVVCALINGHLIGRLSSLLERNFIFEDALALREKIK
jgi:uncharacterized membrane protein YczE